MQPPYLTAPKRLPVGAHLQQCTVAARVAGCRDECVECVDARAHTPEAAKRQRRKGRQRTFTLLTSSASDTLLCPGWLWLPFPNSLFNWAPSGTHPPLTRQHPTSASAYLPIQHLPVHLQRLAHLEGIRAGLRGWVGGIRAEG